MSKVTLRDSKDGRVVLDLELNGGGGTLVPGDPFNLFTIKQNTSVSSHFDTSTITEFENINLVVLRQSYIRTKKLKNI